MPPNRERQIIQTNLLNKLNLASKTIIFSEYADSHFYNGIRTGNNDIFVVNSDTRKRLLAEHESSADLLKPYLRARHVRRWHLEPSELWLVYVPWKFSSKREISDRISIDIAYADSKLKIEYPAIFSYLNNFGNELDFRKFAKFNSASKHSSQTWHIPNEHSKYKQPKIIVSRITKEPLFAYDSYGYYNDDNTFSFSAAGANFFSLSILNSRFARWYFRQVCSTMNDHIRISPLDVAHFPIILPSLNERNWCEFLAKALTYLYSSDSKSDDTDHPLSLMTAYFEQWLNGLIYELFFPEELHEHRLFLFNQCLAITYLDLDELTNKQKNSYLSALFRRVYNIQHPLRAMLFDLSSLNIVQSIEEEP